MKKRLLLTASEDRRCFQRFKHDIYVASGPSIGFSKPLCLHSLCTVTYVLCNLHAKKIDKSSLIQSTIPGHTSWHATTETTNQQNFRGIKKPPFNSRWTLLQFERNWLYQESRKGLYFLLLDQDTYTLTKMACFHVSQIVSWKSACKMEEELERSCKKNLYAKEPLNRNHGDQK